MRAWQTRSRARARTVMDTISRRAWRRPWRAHRSDRLDETKGSDCSKRREASDLAFPSLSLSLSLFLSLSLSLCARRDPCSRSMGLRADSARRKAGYADRVAGRKSELVKSLGGHSGHANRRAYRARTVPIRTTTRCRSSEMRHVSPSHERETERER